MSAFGRFSSLADLHGDAPRLMQAWGLVIALLTAGCAGLPRDPDGTLDRVRRDRAFTVGIIASSELDSRDARMVAFLQRVASRTGAAPRTHGGAAERLLSQLENGELDLVIGELSPRSPWRERVTLLPPLGGSLDGRRDVALTVAARHGENAWLGVLFAEIAAAGGAR